MKVSFEFEDMSRRVFGRHVNCFGYAGFWWSDLDESGFGKPKYGSLSDPQTPPQVRYVPGFKLWQMLGLMPAGCL